jgi:hypothetical protein
VFLLQQLSSLFPSPLLCYVLPWMLATCLRGPAAAGISNTELLSAPCNVPVPSFLLTGPDLPCPALLQPLLLQQQVMTLSQQLMGRQVAQSAASTAPSQASTAAGLAAHQWLGGTAT